MRSVNISVSIPENLLKQLETFCKNEERTKSYAVKKALEKYIISYGSQQKQNENFIKSSNKTFASEWLSENDEEAFSNLQKYHKKTK